MKRAIVMGASSGIGREVALLLLANGWRVGVAARREDALQELCNNYPQQAEYKIIDVTSENAQEELAAFARELGGMDVYVHSSGVGWQNETLDADIELRTIDTNAVGFVRMVGAAFRYFRSEGGGHVVALTSIAGTKGLGPAPAYSATKAFQSNYLEALEQQSCCQKQGITITDIRPGFVDTPLISGKNYPLKLDVKSVAFQIVTAIERKQHVRIIDWRYRLLVFFWRLIPRRLWRRLPLSHS